MLIHKQAISKHIMALIKLVENIVVRVETRSTIAPAGRTMSRPGNVATAASAPISIADPPLCANIRGNAAIPMPSDKLEII